MSTVLVAFCHRADSIAPQFRRCLTMVYMRDAKSRQPRIVGELDKESSANISQARCDNVREFLAHPARPDWLWMVDTDMTFGDGILEQLLRTADPVKRPIVGGLCFGVRPAKIDGVEQFNDCLASPLELFPTVYGIDEQGRILHYFDYPRESAFRVGSTGAACLLIHRSVLDDERWRSDGHPQPWFREAVFHGRVVSEDHFFCIRAGGLNYEVWVDSSARTGHVKTFIADEDLFLAQRAEAVEFVEDGEAVPA